MVDTLALGVEAVETGVLPADVDGLASGGAGARELGDDVLVGGGVVDESHVALHACCETPVPRSNGLLFGVSVVIIIFIVAVLIMNSIFVCHWC